MASRVLLCLVLSCCLSSILGQDDNTTSVRFSTVTYTVSEADNLLSLEVEATATGTPPEMVEITISGFPDTNSSKNFNISSNGVTLANFDGFNDGDLGNDRMFTLTLNSSDGSVTLSTPNTASVTITEDDSVIIGFTSETYSVFEGNTVRVCVNISTGTLVDGRQVVVSASTQDGEAMSDMDYTAVSTDLTFQNPVTAQCINISTIEDPDSMDGEQFTVTLSTSESSTAVSLSPNETTITIRNIPTVTPAEVRVTAQGMTTFTVSEAEASSYQWQFNGTDISGQTSQTLTLTNIMEADEGTYACIVMTSGMVVTSESAQLLVFAAISITDQPVTVTVNRNDTATFSLTATGDERTYQWQRDGVNLNETVNKFVGVTGNMLMVVDAQNDDEGTYTCVVTNGAGDSVMSDAASLIVVVEPSITVQPADAIDVSLGQMVSFMVTAGGDTPTYQWYFVNSSGDDTLIAGAITDTYTIASVGEEDEGMYFCRVSNQAGDVNSSSAMLMLLPLPVVTPSITRVVLVGTATSFNCTATNNATITWTVMDESNGLVSFTGPTVDGDTSTIMVTFASTGDYNVTCTATNGRGSVTESGMTNAVSIEVDNVTVGITATATFFCSVTGLTDPSSIQYLWRQTQNGVFPQTPFPAVIFERRVSGADAATLMIANVGPMDGDFDYTCRVSNSDGGRIVGDATGTLTTNGPEITTGPVDQTLNAGMVLELNCTAVNNDGAIRPLEIMWMFTPSGLGAPVYYAVTDSEVTQTVDNDTVTSVLRIDSVVSTNSGMYGCHAYNRNLRDAVVENATVTVFFTPEVDLQASPAMVQNRRTQTLTCTVTALPVANFAEIVRFSSTGERIVVASDNNMAGDMQFILTHTFTANFPADDGALYQCLAVNDNGPNSDNVTIIVQAIPDAIDHGEVSHVLVTLNSINVTWPIPSDNNAPITEYIINVCLISTTNGSVCVTDTPVPVSSPEELPGNLLRYQLGEIVAQKRYEIYIQAVNIVGSQAYTPLTNGYRFESVSAVNGSVTNLRFVRTTSVVIITWNLPVIALATSGVEAEFNLTYFREGNQVLSSVSVNISYNTTLTEQGYSVDLSDDGPYTFIVTALYNSPISLLSTEVMQAGIMTVDANVALLPNARVTDTVSGTSITFSWPAPENVNFLMNYRVSYSSTPISTSKRRRRQTPSSDILTVPANMRSTDLEFQPYSRYIVRVDAIYNPPNSDGVTVRLLPTTTITTPQGTSGPPSFSQQPARQEGFLRIVLSWIPPANPNGVITGYKVFVNQSRIGSEVVPLMSPVTTWTTPEFLPNTEHTFEVAAINGAPINSGQGNYSSVVTAKTGFGVFQPAIANAVIGTSDSRQFTIAFGPFSSRYGAVGTYQIVVIRNGDISNTLDLRSESLLPENRSSTNYYVAFSGDVPRVQTSFIIGDGRTRKVGNEYFPNPPPETGDNYQVFIRVYSQINTTVFNDSSLTRVLRIETPLNPAVIIGPIAAIAVVLLIILVVLLLVVFFFTRPRRGYTIASSGEDGHRKKGARGIELRRTRLFSPVVNVPVPDVFTSAGQPTTLVCEASGTPAPEVVWTQNNEQLDKERFIMLADSSLFINDTDLKDEGAYIVTATNSAGTAEQMVRVTVIRPSPPEPDPDHKPIQVGEFSEKIALLRANDDEGLEDEYSELEPDVTFTSYAAKVNINKNKNRYINIIPYDHSRVVLALQDNTPGSDYVNASYIDGFNRPNAYIATQGPQPSTFPDFWRMIWEFDCPTIVMVTNLKEEDKLKCHQYWPNYGTTTYGNVQVTLKGVENLAEYSIRTFHITPIAGQSRVQMPVREVKQFHFLVWPDHGVPQFATPLLSFRKRVAKYHPDKKGPMVVHCSAGVGRTGTFITIDTMLRQMESEGIIDIFNFVRHMRFRRNYMVQTGPQYVFIHDALLEAIMCGDNSIPAPELRKRFEELMDVDPESNKSRIQLQFENLNNNSPQDDDFDSTIATLPDNMAKNRFKVHLPANDYRVPLGAVPPHSEAGDEDEDEDEKEKEEPDYICASFADGYRQRNAFIITQAPITSTTGDFWKMIWEQKSAAIVMLTELEEDGKEMSVKYWPSEVGTPGLFGSFQVELSENEKDKGDYVTRKFKLSHVDAPQECRIVTQFHFTKWPRTSTPSNPHSVIDLIDEIQRVQRKSGNQPITIHCDDGVSRTGAFCTLYSVLERVKVDQVVDVYLATKTLRIQRAGLLETLDQYKFVHKAVLVFLDSFSDYQNFK